MFCKNLLVDEIRFPFTVPCDPDPSERGSEVEGSSILAALAGALSVPAIPPNSLRFTSSRFEYSMLEPSINKILLVPADTAVDSRTVDPEICPIP